MSGGTDHGVMKYVGEAVSMLQASTKVVAFGIAPWGMIMNKVELTAEQVRCPIPTSGLVTLVKTKTDFFNPYTLQTLFNPNPCPDWRWNDLILFYFTWIALIKLEVIF